MKRNLLILQLACSAVFLGRGWQFILWDAPYRAFFWDESIMGPVARLFGFNWSEYLNSFASDQSISQFIVVSGIIFVLCAMAVWILPKWKKVLVPLIALGVIQLLFLSFLYWKEQFFIIAQFIEYALQWSTPLFLLYFIKKTAVSSRMLIALKIAIALTFVGHGLYALGLFFPVPGHFTAMVIQILGVSQEQSAQLLFWAGVLDMIIGIGIFLPYRWSKWIIIYAIFWGLATTAARIWAHFYIDNLEFVFWRWVPEALFRFPHFMMPYFLYLALKKN